MNSVPSLFIQDVFRACPTIQFKQISNRYKRAGFHVKSKRVNVMLSIFTTPDGSKISYQTTIRANLPRKEIRSLSLEDYYKYAYHSNWLYISVNSPYEEPINDPETSWEDPKFKKLCAHFCLFGEVEFCDWSSRQKASKIYSTLLKHGIICHSQDDEDANLFVGNLSEPDCLKFLRLQLQRGLFLSLTLDLGVLKNQPLFEEIFKWFCQVSVSRTRYFKLTSDVAVKKSKVNQTISRAMPWILKMWRTYGTGVDDTNKCIKIYNLSELDLSILRSAKYQVLESVKKYRIFYPSDPKRSVLWTVPDEEVGVICLQ
ncbi:hypothetical protein L596_026261 [Steinernema carpocapsae]|uniref:Uncharacterized protein n=1 Tax=Steinernema carpocapsae TaxID=34508 RepID=A0A4U5M0U2_STECR|nr:hypothetical protein L596_026261 [Steinernema carpocapsae]